MKSNIKPVEELTPQDLEESPVWQYANSDEVGETAVRPIKTTPVRSLTARVVGVPVELANGRKVWGLLGNVDASNARLTEHFLTLSVEQDGKWFTMARYHDFDAEENGPLALARFLGMKVRDVFPIRYDISRWCKGEPAALAGEIPENPRERLSLEQIMALAVPKKPDNV
jgi:hypothetical protein